MGGTNRWVYDGLSRVVHQVDPLNQTNSFAYDLAGNVTNLWDARGFSYGFTYDTLGRKLTMAYPDGTSESWAYDALGRATNLTTRAGQTLASTYDNRGRVTLANWSDSTPDVAMDYDAAGRLLTNSTSVSVLVYTYNDGNELLSEKQTVSGQSSRTVSYTYDNDGNRLSLTYPGGAVVTNTFTARNQLLGLYVDGTPAMAAFSYDATGARTNLSLENGTGTRYAYDIARRLTNMVLTTNSTTFSAFAYGYNSVGNRTNRSETLGGSSWTDAYTYDGTDQVTNVNYSSGSRVVGYAYDAVGNRTSVTDNSQTTSYAVNGANQYTNITGASPVTNLTHSLNGNLTSGGGWTNIFDAQNRLTEVAPSAPAEGGKKITFAYDGRNRCVNRKTYSWASDNWQLLTDHFLIYDGWNLIEERDGNGTLLQTYIHGPRVDEILLKVTGANAIYYHHDALGSVTSLTDANGVIVERYLYDIYGQPTVLDAGGNVISGTGQTNRFLFTGREWLADVSLYDYRNRVYSALLGRFLQTDPIRFEAGDANMYRYVNNASTMKCDPTGLAPFQDRWDGAGGGAMPGPYPTEMVAVQSLVPTYTLLTAQTGNECGGYIYTVHSTFNYNGLTYTTTQFSYTVTMGTPTNVPLERPQSNYTAMWHTHPHVHTHGIGDSYANYVFRPSYNFSPTDIEIANGYQIKSYLLTPSNQVYLYNPNETGYFGGGTITTIYTPPPPQQGPYLLQYGL